MYKEKNKIYEEKGAIRVFKVIIIIVCLILIAIYIFNIQRGNIRFELLGSNDIMLELAEEYQEPGFISEINNRDVSEKVRVSSDININKVGDYKIEYNLRIIYLGINKTLYRQVHIQDTTKPNLKINSEKEVTVKLGDKYVYPTYNAVDNYDGDITNKVLV